MVSKQASSPRRICRRSPISAPRRTATRIQPKGDGARGRPQKGAIDREKRDSVIADWVARQQGGGAQTARQPCASTMMRSSYAAPGVRASLGALSSVVDMKGSNRRRAVRPMPACRWECTRTAVFS